MKAQINNRSFNVKDCKGIKSVKGLMFDSMKKHQGALIYANSIWMPFVSHELDLIFLGSNFKVLEIVHAVPMKLHPKTWKIYDCDKAKYCLEMKHGLVKAKKGMKVKLYNQEK